MVVRKHNRLQLMRAWRWNENFPYVHTGREKEKKRRKERETPGWKFVFFFYFFCLASFFCFLSQKKKDREREKKGSKSKFKTRRRRAVCRRQGEKEGHSAEPWQDPGHQQTDAAVDETTCALRLQIREKSRRLCVCVDIIANRATTLAHSIFLFPGCHSVGWNRCHPIRRQLSKF